MPATDAPDATSPQRKLKIKPLHGVHAKPDASGEHEPPPAPATSGRSALLHKLAWIVLLAWLLYLAFRLLDPLPFLFPDKDDTGGRWRMDRADSETPRQEDAAPDHPALVALKQKVAAAIVARDLEDAMTAIRTQARAPMLHPYPQAIEELARTVVRLQHVNRLVADIVREHIDAAIVIRIKNRPVTIIPRASAGERVNALIEPQDDSHPQRSATFKITDLAPLERARLVGTAETVEQCLMKLYLYLEAGDRDGAQAFAPGCGILAQDLGAQLGAAAP